MIKMAQVKILIKGTVKASFSREVEIDEDKFNRLNASGKLNDYLENEAVEILSDNPDDLDPDLGDVELYSWQVE